MMLADESYGLEFEQYDGERLIFVDKSGLFLVVLTEFFFPENQSLVGAEIMLTLVFVENYGYELWKARLRSLRVPEVSITATQGRWDSL